MEEIVFNFKNSVVNVENTWSEIGHAPTRRAELRDLLKNNLTSFLNGFLSSAESEKAEITHKVDQMQVVFWFQLLNL